MARKTRIAQAFGAAAYRYDRHAGPQAHAAELVARLAAQQAVPSQPSILEIGCGTGLLTAYVARHWPNANLTVTDIAPAMVSAVSAHPTLAARLLVMDGEYPDIAGQYFDLILSSLAFQWFDCLPVALTRLHALLRPGGSLVFSTMLADSFAAWRAAHQVSGLTPPPSGYPSLAGLNGILADYPDAFAFDETYPLDCGDARGLVEHFRGIGADVPPTDYTPLGPAQMRRVMAAFDAAGGNDAYVVGFARITRIA